MTTNSPTRETVEMTNEENRPVQRTVPSKKNFCAYFSLTWGALGVVFGDIGTSPLYVLNTVFLDNPNPSHEQCLGVVSLVIWILIILVTIKYAIFILMADHQGEGGTFALCGLLTGDRSQLNKRTKHLIGIVSIFGASLLIGDGALTPAISILSAVEGVSTTSASLTPWILPISCVLILFLFIIQILGTSKIGFVFAPVMLIWFITIFILGVWTITFQPLILHAFNPWQAISYLIREKQRGFLQLGGVFLSATGLEALYADLGHFGRGPVRISWLLIVFPSVIANYLGQGALIMMKPSSVTSPFYNLSPTWFRWPLIILSTLATSIASQAVITGVFSLMNQAASLGYSPPLRVIHTSNKVFGQIYVPMINWIVMFITLGITLEFRHSESIAHAFGLTVCSVMVITTVLYMCVMRYVWNQHWILVMLFSVFLLFDLVFLAANVMKFLEGAWVALLVAIVFFTLGFSWYYGQSALRYYLHCYAKTTTLIQLPERLGLASVPFNHVSNRESLEIDHEMGSSSDDDDDDVNNHPTKPILHLTSSVRNRKNATDGSLEERQPLRNNESYTVTPGLGVFLTTSARHNPHVFERVLDQIHACPETIIFLKFEYARIPQVQLDQRIKIRTYASGQQQQIHHLTARYGYCEPKIDLMELLQHVANDHGLTIPDERQITFYAPAISIRVIRRGWKVLPSKWILHLYSFLKHLFPYGQKNVRYPPDLTVTVGVVVPL